MGHPNPASAPSILLVLLEPHRLHHVAGHNYFVGGQLKEEKAVYVFILDSNIWGFVWKMFKRSLWLYCSARLPWKPRSLCDVIQTKNWLVFVVLVASGTTKLQWQVSGLVEDDPPLLSFLWNRHSTTVLLWYLCMPEGIEPRQNLYCYIFCIAGCVILSSMAHQKSIKIRI